MREDGQGDAGHALGCPVWSRPPPSTPYEQLGCDPVLLGQALGPRGTRGGRQSPHEPGVRAPLGALRVPAAEVLALHPRRNRAVRWPDEFRHRLKNDGPGKPRGYL